MSKNTTSTPDLKENPESHDTNSKLIITICVVGGVFLVVIVVIVLYCCRKWRRKRTENKHEPRLSIVRGDVSVHSELFDTGGKLNPGLQLSDQDISMPAKENRMETIICEEAPPPYNNREVSEKSTYDVSIKLLTPWNDIYMDPSAKEYLTMKNYIESSMNSLYISYDEFQSATLLKFRNGSLIADVQLKFTASAFEPLMPLKHAVQSGKCAELVVDDCFFQILQPVSNSTNGFTKTVSNKPKEKLSDHDVIAENRHANKRDLKGMKRESGYGSVEFDPAELHQKLNKHQKKMRESSTKSTQSCDSVTSEMGTSYSVSPKSCSSTNISIHSVADVDHLEHSSNRRKGLFSSLNRPGKKYHETTKKKFPANVVGEPHIALFDFKPQDYRELALHKGELVRVTYIDNGGWVKAFNEQNVQGWIPHNFVTPIDPEKYSVIKRSVEVVSLIDDVVDHEEIPHPGDTSYKEGYYSVPRSSTSHKHSSEDDEEDKDSSDLSSEDISGLFVTIFPFDPSEKNELKLEVGDLIDVLKTDETGWWKGECLRTQADGWFPSSYVKPYSEIEIQEEEDKGTVSDNEVQRRASSIMKSQHRDEGGYSSDNGEARVKKRDVMSTKKLTADQNVGEEKQESHATSSNGVKLRNRGAPKERAVSLIIDIDSGCGKVHFPAPLTPPPRLSAHHDHGNNMFPDPPTKPVPPKPRIRHIEKTYRNLVAAGKLGSTDSLKTVSTECLVNLGRSVQKGGSWKRRRNSEDAVTSLSFDEIVIRGENGLKPVSRARPKSFQETPKNSFFYLANRYVNMKPAFSLPSLVRDQVKLSPDDDRPFLDPIPRKAKSRSFRDDELSLKEEIISKRISSSLKDLSLVHPQRPYLEPIPRKSRKSGNPPPDETLSQPIKLPYENGKGYTVTRHDKQNYKVEVPNNFLPSTTTKVTDNKHSKTPTKPLPPEPGSEIEVENSDKPVVTPKPLPANSILSQLLGVNNTQASRPPIVCPKPTVPVRTTSKNVGAKKLIEEHRARQSLTVSNAHTRTPLVGGRLRTQRHFSSFESINEEVEQASTPKDESLKLPTEHDHRRSRSEPHERILKNELNYYAPPTEGHSAQENSPSLSPVHISYDEKTEHFTYNSRASSLQSLNSIASSTRSTASSSKREQANLRRAIMNVHGQGENDLSFKVNAILFEIRPKNKQGLCLGILEDSTQGWYPEESVEIFQQEEF